MFYPIAVEDENFQAILDISVNFANRKPRCSVDLTTAILEPKEGEESNPILEGYPALTQQQAFQLMQTEAWQTPST